MPLACSAYGDGGPKVIAIPTIVVNQCGGGDEGVMRWMDGASERAQARVEVVLDVKSVRQKIFVLILLSLSSRDYFSVGFPVTRAGRGTGSAAATPGAVCVTTRGRRQTVTNGNF